MKSKELRKFQKILRIYAWPFNFFGLYVILAIASIHRYYNFLLTLPEKESLQIAQLLFETLLGVTTTAVALLVPIFIQRNLTRESERKSLVFSLSAMWTELRSIKHTLKEINSNFTFTQTLKVDSSLISIDKKVFLITQKFQTFSQILDKLSTDSHSAALGNLTISFIDSDQLYNSVNQTYEDIHYLVQTFNLVLGGLHLRELSIQIILSAGESVSTTKFEAEVQEDLANKLEMCHTELLTLINKIDSCIHDLKKSLERFGIEAEEVYKKTYPNTNLNEEKNE